MTMISTASILASLWILGIKVPENKSNDGKI